MDFQPVLIASRSEAMRAAGHWEDRTILDHLRIVIDAHPDRIAAVEYRADRSDARRLTYREIWDRSLIVAANLARIGVGRGDVVSFQLPNWIEFIDLSLACAHLGAVANPLMHIFRQRELSFMLPFGESKVLVVPSSYRGYDYPAMAREVVDALSSRPLLIVVDGNDEESSYAHVLLADIAGTAPETTLESVQPDDVCLLMYTSGTTGEPKGVMHTSNTLFANVRGFIQRLQLTANDVVLGASPMAHLTGYGYLAMMPLSLGATTVLQDTWDPRRALDIVAAEGVTFSMASAPFVSDLCDAATQGAPVSSHFSTFCCAGAPIPPPLIERASSVLGLTVSSAWGMTENGAVTITEPARAAEKSGISDGRPVPGMEVRVVDGANQEVAVGVTGSLLVRGASLFGGYLKRPELNGVDADGWFDTGDLAFLDAEGYIRIDGRTKDIIIRGGENLPVLEIENALYGHPSVAAVAVVGFSDERLGERACAFVTTKPGTILTLDTMRSFLTDAGMAKQYHPERLQLIDEMPRTASGKIQKFALRTRANEAT